MRKLLILLAFVVAGSAAFSVFTPQASADQVQCPKTDTSESHLSKIRTDCKSTCKDTYKNKKAGDGKTFDGCNNSCDSTYNSCVAKYKDWDKKKAECRKPIVACWDKCTKDPAGKKKCEDKCSDDLADKLGDCATRAME
jgi:hypothetical protein